MKKNEFIGVFLFMKDAILEILHSAGRPLSVNEICAQSSGNARNVQLALDELMRDARATRTRKGKFAAAELLGLIRGRAFFTHGGAPMLIADDSALRLRIVESRLKPLPDDLLLCRSLGGDACEIEQICARKMTSICGCVRFDRDRRRHGQREFERVHAAATPCDPRIPYLISLGGDLSFVHNNELALIAIDAYPEGNSPIRGHVERILGNASSMLARMRTVAETHGFPDIFPENVESEALPGVPKISARRADFRNMLIFTIDGASSRDFDDAVSIEAISGGWRLGVHIADVSHYVRPISAIDREALERGTSLYLPGLTVPMLPETLSNDLCSLLPNADRAAMSLIMDISADGRVTDHKLTRSLIRSHARLTYDGVNRLFDGATGSIAPEVQRALDEMRILSNVLTERRRAHGGIDLDMPEAEFVLNERCEPTEILCRPRGEAERMIENFMLAANECVARLARDAGLPFVYRIHEAPDPERMLALEAFLNLNGQHVHLGEHPHPGMLQKALTACENAPERDSIRRMMLRSLKKARYAAQPLGHYALAMNDYCHFTSPIRRYPDLTVHRMLKLLLDGDAAQLSAWEARVAEIAALSSLREQEAAQAEREADDIMKAAWMSRQIGRKFYGVVSGATAWGAYVMLDNTVEGLIHVSDLDDYYVFDPERCQLTAAMSGKTLKLGVRVRVRAIGASIERGEINFELLEIVNT